MTLSRLPGPSTGPTLPFYNMRPREVKGHMEATQLAQEASPRLQGPAATQGAAWVPQPLSRGPREGEMGSMAQRTVWASSQVIHFKTSSGSYIRSWDCEKLQNLPRVTSSPVPEPGCEPSPSDPKPGKCTQYYWRYKVTKHTSPSVQWARDHTLLGTRRRSQCFCPRVPAQQPPSTTGPASQRHCHSPGWGGGRAGTSTGEDARAPAGGSGSCKATPEMAGPGWEAKCPHVNPVLFPPGLIWNHGSPLSAPGRYRGWGQPQVSPSDVGLSRTYYTPSAPQFDKRPYNPCC